MRQHCDLLDLRLLRVVQAAVWPLLPAGPAGHAVRCFCVLPAARGIGAAAALRPHDE